MVDGHPNRRRIRLFARSFPLGCDDYFWHLVVATDEGAAGCSPDGRETNPTGEIPCYIHGVRFDRSILILSAPSLDSIVLPLEQGQDLSELFG